jgi:ribosomal protein S18 acetylase RimI-like enzyme
MNRNLMTQRGTVLIREATPADADAFRELRLYALQESPVAFGADYQASLNQPPHYWEERLTLHADEAALFFAEHDGQLIGMTGIGRGSSPKTRHSASIWSVYVRPEWRGLRIAEELIRACLTWARARTIVAAKLGVNSANTSAIRCYERCGFRISGTEPRAIYYENQYHDFYMMYRPLDD